ncbi:flagellar brake domain-containing protein [Clostridium sp. LBM24168]
MEEASYEKNIYIGLRIEFVNGKKFFEGIVIKVYDNCFAVNVPVDQDNYSTVKLDDTVNYLVAYKDRAFKCQSKILGLKLGDKFSLLIIDNPNILNSIERRRYPRIKAVMDIGYYFINDNLEYKKIQEVPKAYFSKVKKTFSIDLSSNGINIITYEDKVTPKYALVSLFIKEKIDILCSIVRSEYDEKNKNYRTAMHFEDLDSNKWQYIDEFVHSKLK